ncbi:hypothetical protein B5S28_g4760 [[Candida] boidinii]|nr:hypothetical protein B5S28_g4760 [[Candida] boidinii]OWB64087.1 hypothetical protein B5S29_g5123 [[Candida] boidinii]OWB75254.1 hypothetical protein B5S31_g5127 [[Candida] boidinii]OWB80903.1 hypothetical protein B5S32_g5229 [[Candida] boidinii]GMF04866.1 unnamed protein product [[Candida] boidinii]
MKFLSNFLIISSFLINLINCLKYQDVLKLTPSDGTPLILTDNNYKKFINSEREDFNIVLFLTASQKQIGCSACSEYLPVLNNLASSYSKNLKNYLNSNNKDNKIEDNLIFAISDFANSRKFFQELKLNSVPKLWILSKGSKGTHSDIQYSFTSPSASINDLTQWLKSNFKNDASLYHVVEKIDYGSIIFTLSGILFGLYMIYRNLNQFLDLFKSTTIWKSISIVITVIFTTGYMFNQIRNTPYTRTDRNGNTSYINPSYNNQYGIETQIISALYVSLAVITITLVKTIPTLKNNSLKLILSIALSISSYVIYNTLLNCFSIKNSSYPFKFFNIL